MEEQADRFKERYLTVFRSGGGGGLLIILALVEQRFIKLDIF